MKIEEKEKLEEVLEPRLIEWTSVVRNILRRTDARPGLEARLGEVQRHLEEVHRIRVMTLEMEFLILDRVLEVGVMLINLKESIGMRYLSCMIRTRRMRSSNLV